MEMTPERWRYTEEYTSSVFGAEDEAMRRARLVARDAGLPDIAISPEVGRLLSILTAMTPGRLALEVGTLGGYSALWILRGLAADGRLITIEAEPRHADVAAHQFMECGASDRVDLRRGTALDVLPAVARDVGPGSVDIAFLDADKTEYLDYWWIVRPLLRAGGLLVADNALGSSRWWIDDEQDPARDGADRLNRAVASDGDFDSVAVPIRQGVLIARRLR